MKNLGDTLRSIFTLLIVWVVVLSVLLGVYHWIDVWVTELAFQRYHETGGVVTNAAIAKEWVRPKKQPGYYIVRDGG